MWNKTKIVVIMNVMKDLIRLIFTNINTKKVMILVVITVSLVSENDSFGEMDSNDENNTTMS